MTVNLAAKLDFHDISNLRHKSNNDQHAEWVREQNNAQLGSHINIWTELSFVYSL